MYAPDYKYPFPDDKLSIHQGTAILRQIDLLPAISNKRISIESMSAGMRMKQRMAELVRANKRSKKWIRMIIYPYRFDTEQLTEIPQIFTQLFI